MESLTPIVVQGGRRFRGVVGPLVSVFVILRYFEKFLPLIDGTGALLLISMLIVLLLILFFYLNTIMFSTVKTNIAKDYVLP